MKLSTMANAALFCIGIAGCRPTGSAESPAAQDPNPAAPNDSQSASENKEEAMIVYEIAIQKVKPETAAEYPNVRAEFLQKLSEQPGNEKDWTLKSFFTMPEPDDADVLVGITRWSSLDAFQQASAKLSNTELAGSLFSKVEMKAFVQVRPVGDEAFKLEEQFSGGTQVLEVAVRRPKDGISEEDYIEARNAFFADVAKQPGYLFDQEFLDDQGNRVVLIGWESMEAFQGALGTLQKEPSMGSFFSIIDVSAYQATQMSK